MLSKHLIANIVRWLAALVVVLAVAAVAVYLSERPLVTPQNLIQSLADAKTPSPQQKVLVFSPHPDDETIAVGGYIANARMRGDAVRIVLITNGNRHHQETMRYSEFRQATSILGVDKSDLVFLGFPDGQLRKLDPSVLTKAFREQIDSYNPDFIIYPHIRDAHPDHYTAGRIIEAIVAAGISNKPTTYQYLVHFQFFYPQPYKYAPDLYLSPPISLVTDNFEWLKFLLSPSIEDLKRRAIYSYRSQINDPLLRGLIFSSIRKNELLAASSP